VCGGNLETQKTSCKQAYCSGGADHVLERADGGPHLDVRLTLETDEGDLISMTYTGRRNGSPDIMAKIVKREPIPQGADYFRVAIQFETSAKNLLWFNDIIVLGTGVSGTEWSGLRGI
jgi:uncharacterized protein DUF3237